MAINKSGIADSHTHCWHSSDSSADPRIMIEAAIKAGAEYYAITDHDDRDFIYLLPEYKKVRQLDVVEHIDTILTLKDKYKDRIYVGLGIECGYSAEAAEDNRADIALTDRWDIILNSVHTVNRHDVYYEKYFKTYDRNAAYRHYLQAVLESLNAPYEYDAVAHLGYVTRKAPYQDNSAMTFSEFGDMIDAVLLGIIDKGVSLEINTNCKYVDYMYLPDVSIVDRYVELGGVDFTYGSDAHQDSRVLENYKYVRDMLVSKNIKYLNCYKQRVKTPLKIK